MHSLYTGFLPVFVRICFCECGLSKQWWSQLGSEKGLERKGWEGASWASGRVSSPLLCFMAHWPFLRPSSTMCSCFIMWRHLCPSTRSIKSPSGWERWVKRTPRVCLWLTAKLIGNYSYLYSTNTRQMFYVSCLLSKLILLSKQSSQVQFNNQIG